MKLLFLGTGAADYAVKPEEQMTENDRRYSSILVDGEFLLDAAPQSFGFAQRCEVDFSKIKFVLVSHTHYDHYCKESVVNFAKQSGRKLKLFCHEDAVERLGLTEEDRQYVEPAGVKIMSAFETEGYKITPLAANHIVDGSPEVPLHYIIEDKDGKRYFYGCDGGWFVALTWEYMRKLKFDGMILEATVGDKDGDFRLGTHNSIPMLRLIVAALWENKMIDDNTRLIASHIARTLHVSHEDTSEKLKQIGIDTAFDGFEAEF